MIVIVALPVLLLMETSDGDEQNVRVGGALANAGRCFVAVDRRHADIHHHYVGFQFLCQGHGFAPVAGFSDHREIVLGKMMAYFVVGVADATLALLVGLYVFGVPLRGSILVLAVSTCAFLFGALFMNLGWLNLTLPEGSILPGSSAVPSATRTGVVRLSDQLIKFRR